MSDQRFIIEMGMGNSQYGQDYTKAAARAIEDAIRHSSITLFAALDLDPAEMRVDVTIGVQKRHQGLCQRPRAFAAWQGAGESRVWRHGCCQS